MQRKGRKRKEKSRTNNKESECIEEKRRSNYSGREGHHSEENTVLHGQGQEQFQEQ